MFFLGGGGGWWSKLFFSEWDAKYTATWRIMYPRPSDLFQMHDGIGLRKVCMGEVRVRMRHFNTYKIFGEDERCARDFC